MARNQYKTYNLKHSTNLTANLFIQWVSNLAAIIDQVDYLNYSDNSKEAI